ncbi:hypothetical protein SUDANB121_00216 [Nocardiopsis dassonvillei]|uniref:hypothetical protein n=1 Tax=Nocardiopsis dassonvillei TaxID=2014 RepID=UPI003F54A7BA
MRGHRENPPTPLVEGRIVMVCSVLATLVTLLMLWTWTDAVPFAVIALCLLAGVGALGLVHRRSGSAELVGGPFDGARIGPARAASCRRRGELVLSDREGTVRYSPDRSGRLVHDPDHGA